MRSGCDATRGPAGWRPAICGPLNSHGNTTLAQDLRGLSFMWLPSRRLTLSLLQALLVHPSFPSCSCAPLPPERFVDSPYIAISTDSGVWTGRVKGQPEREFITLRDRTQTKWRTGLQTTDCYLALISCQNSATNIIIFTFLSHIDSHIIRVTSRRQYFLVIHSLDLSLFADYAMTRHHRAVVLSQESSKVSRGLEIHADMLLMFCMMLISVCSS